MSVGAQTTGAYLRLDNIYFYLPSVILKHRMPQGPAGKMP